MLTRWIDRMRTAAMLTLITSSACVLPADPLDRSATPSFAPRLNLDSASPSAAVSPVDVDDCSAISVEILGSDPDDVNLLVRWVVRDEDETRWLTDNIARERIQRTVPVGATAFARQREAIRNEAGNRAATITVYVTDAPTWQIENPDVGPGLLDPNVSGVYPPGFNLGAIPDTSATSGRVFSVVSHSWTFEFNDRGLPCP